MKIVCSLNAQVLKCFAYLFINLFFSPFGGGGVAGGAGEGRIVENWEQIN